MTSDRDSTCAISLPCHSIKTGIPYLQNKNT